MFSQIDSGTSVPMVVSGLRERSKGIFELELTHQGFVFEAGECVVIFGPEGVSRPYSIASSPLEQGALRVLFRKMPNGILTSWLCDRAIGDALRVSYPFGDFRPDPVAREGHDAPVFIATGVGIAPFLSALRLAPVRQPKPVCIYGVRALGDVMDRALLSEASDLRLAVSRDPVAGLHHGHVNALVQALDLHIPRHYYLCGLDAMVYALSDWLEEQGVPAERVHTEIFFTAS